MTDRDRLVGELSSVPGIEVTVHGALIDVRVPAIGDRVRVDPEAVVRSRRIFSPSGEPAVELVLRDDEALQPLIITVDDVVWAPAEPGAVLDSLLPVRITNAPHLVAYSEMERAAFGLADSVVRPDGNLDLIGADLLLVRCFIAGALRVGLWPVRAAAWWRHAWAVSGGESVVGSYRPDAVWDRLLREAATVPLDRPPTGAPEEFAAEVARLTVANVEAEHPAMTVSRADEEFVAAWRQWVPIPPRRFAELMKSGLPDARFEVALYPDGRGSVDLRIGQGAVPQALVQLRFLMPERYAEIDEIRISDSARGGGMFQRLMFNTESLATALGLTTLRLHATGVGAYALAALHAYPRDPSLRQTRRPDQR